ncbi:uncharacterized protein LOC143143720 isoform X8 [Ptiloglossa arizonensis]|uniref:uncharacterized protein LOC143143720 isoform X8 n=1 Tax=Ptiloglossa arizonensis TaxID=3350558 RepID=UPI003FA09B33
MQFFLSLFFKQYWHIECSGFGQLGQLPFRWNRKQLLAREWIIGIQPIYAVIGKAARNVPRRNENYWEEGGGLGRERET